MQFRHFTQRGMTLIELIVVISLFSVLSLVILKGIQKMYDYNAYTFAQAHQLQNARKGHIALVRDMREMTFSDNGSFPLVKMKPHIIGFYSDIDRDNSVEYVEYELVANTTLEKRLYEASGSPLSYKLSTPSKVITISEYVQNYNQGIQTFTYYDETHNEVTDGNVTRVRYIAVQLVINIDPVRDPRQYMLRSSAALRNIKENS